MTFYKVHTLGRVAETPENHDYSEDSEAKYWQFNVKSRQTMMATS